MQMQADDFDWSNDSSCHGFRSPAFDITMQAVAQINIFNKLQEVVPMRAMSVSINEMGKFSAPVFSE